MGRDQGKTSSGFRKADVHKGDVLKFGRYPQTKEGKDQTPIEWKVLEVQGNEALLIAQYGLDAKPYHKDFVDITWEKCTLRSWLNQDFLMQAFHTDEQRSILETNVDNSWGRGYVSWYADGGRNTRDKLFLLSYAGAEHYYGVTYEDTDNINARVQPTAYARAQGAYADNSYKTANGAAAGWWWLRSPGSLQNCAACVSHVGSLYFDGVRSDNACVRPAFWLNLES